MKYILITILLIGCLATAQETDPDTTVINSVALSDTTLPAEPAPLPPESLNRFLGTATDTVMIIGEFVSVVNDQNVITWKRLKRTRSQDKWENSQGNLIIEYYEQLGNQWVKINPETVFRITTIPK